MLIKKNVKKKIKVKLNVCGMNPLPDDQNNNKEEYFLMDKKGEVDEKNDRDEANLTKIANLLSEMPITKRQPFVDLIKGYLNDEV